MALITSGRAQIWSLDPLVLTIDNFFDAKELHYIRTHAEGNAQPTPGAARGRTEEMDQPCLIHLRAISLFTVKGLALQRR